MDDQVNQAGVGMTPPPPVGGTPASPLGGPPPPPMGGPVAGEDPHEKIIAALTRIEEKLVAIAAKVGA